ncbi:cell division protein ZapA [bacterium]|nr:cell division protein ZapA [bacterium]
MKIQITGRTFTMKSSISEEQVRRLEEHIEAKYQKLCENKNTKAGSSFDRDLVLLLINIANDFLEEKDKIDYLKKEMLLKIDSLINKIDGIL